MSIFKLLIKEIRRNIGRFIAILLIVLIGVGFLSGLLSSVPDMEYTTDKFYDQNRFWDINIKSTMGFSSADMSEVSQNEYVKGVSGSVNIDDVIKVRNKEYTAKLCAIDFLQVNSVNAVSKFTLKEGSYANNETSCVVVVSKAFADDIQIGDEITLTDKADALKVSSLTVTGKVVTPDYMSIERESSTVGNGTVKAVVYISKNALATQQIRYTDLYLTVNGASELDCFSKDYEELIDKATDSLKELGTQISQKTMDDMYNSFKNEVATGIGDAESKISDLQEQLRTSEKGLADAKAKIDLSEREIAASENLLSETNNKLAEQKKQIDSKKMTIDALKLLAEQGTATEEMLKKIDEYDKTVAEYNSSKSSYEQKKSELEHQKNSLAISKENYEVSKNLFESQKKTAEAEIEKIKQNLDSSNSVEQPQYSQSWYVLNRETNVSYVSYKSNIEKINAIAKVFPIVLFLVAALVVLTTMSRMVEEQRIEIGTRKALGYSKNMIIANYLLYSGTASVLGSIIGIAIGITLIPRIIRSTYDIMYSYPELITRFIPAYTLPAAIIAVSGSLAVSFYACEKSLSEKPAALMLPTAPPKGKRIFLENNQKIWSKLSFIHKVTARNLFLYKKRFIMTVVGIAGCMALLLTGFGLRDSIGDVVKKQYNEIQKYSLSVSLVNNTDISADEDLSAFLNNSEKVSGYGEIYTETADIKSGDTDKSISVYVPLNTDNFTEFVNLKKCHLFGGKIKFGDESVVVTEKFAKENGIKKGKVITVTDSSGLSAEFKVTDICENYIYDYIYIGKPLYEKGFSKSITTKKLLVKYNGDIADNLSVGEQLLKIPNVTGVTFSSDVIESFGRMMDKIDNVVILLIVSAGLLAFIVLYNLTNINISERQKEIGTVKVLGFHKSEVCAYIFREIFVITVIGVLLGIILGIVLHAYIVKTAEVDVAMFGRTIYPLSYLWSVIMTFGFSAVVCFVMSFKLHKISMADAMKSNE